MSRFTITMIFEFNGTPTERDKDKIKWHFQDADHTLLIDNINIDMIDTVPRDLKIDYED